jgi:hypothetical protein
MTQDIQQQHDFPITKDISIRVSLLSREGKVWRSPDVV